MRAERGADRLDLGGVIHGRPGAVCIDVADGLRVDSSVAKRCPHRARRPLRRRLGNVVRVR